MKITKAILLAIAFEDSLTLLGPEAGRAKPKS
jgi:hypothetical protein